MNWGFLVLCVSIGMGIGLDMSRWGKTREVEETPAKTFICAVIEIVLVLWAMHWRM
jgi:hypothetical protein